jgi:hypothetical protein
MSTFLCWIWPYLCGAFVGWLAAGLLARLFAQTQRAVVQVVEKIIDRVVEIPITDDRALAAKDQELAALRARLADSEAELKTLQDVLVAGARQ